MSTMVNDNLQNNDMASNISNLNNMPNIAKNAEYGIDNMAHLDNIQNKNIMIPQAMQQQYHNQQQQQYQMPDTGLYQQQQQMPQIDTSAGKNTLLDKATRNLKEPLVIAVIFVILNHPSFLSAIKKYCPSLTPSEDNTVLNLVLRGLIMGGIIVLINKTVLK